MLFVSRNPAGEGNERAILAAFSVMAFRRRHTLYRSPPPPIATSVTRVCACRLLAMSIALGETATVRPIFLGLRNMKVLTHTD